MLTNDEAVSAGPWRLLHGLLFSRTSKGIGMNSVIRWMAKRLVGGGAIVAVVAVTLALAGCEKKEKVIDIKAPGVDVTIERDVDSGAVNVEVDGDK
jgi:hypothetical protein